MKPINKDEIYENLSTFLKSRGIELTDGSYARGIQQTCNFLTDSINLSQQGVHRAKTEFDRNIDRVRQVIHEHTAPRQAAPATGETAETVDVDADVKPSGAKKERSYSKSKARRVRRAK